MKHILVTAIVMAVASSLLVLGTKLLLGNLVNIVVLKQLVPILYFNTPYITFITGIFFGWYATKRVATFRLRHIIVVFLLYVPLYIILSPLMSAFIVLLSKGVDPFLRIVKLIPTLVLFPVMMENGNAASTYEMLINILQLAVSIILPVLCGFVLMKSVLFLKGKK